MWKAAQRLGFKGGLTLESSVGTGNFRAQRDETTPRALRQNRTSGVEFA